MPLPSSSRRGSGSVSHAELDAVRHVALTAMGGDVDAARLVSKSVWNDAREEAGCGWLSKAETLRQRAGMDWPAFVGLSFLPVEDRARDIGTRRRRVSALNVGAVVPYLDELPPEDQQAADALLADLEPAVPVEPPSEIERQVIRRAIRVMAFAHGSTPSAQAYDELVVRAEQQRSRRGLPINGYPTSAAVLKRYDSWVTATDDAGLAPPPAPRNPSGLALLEVLEEATDWFGCVPYQALFMTWAETCDVSVANEPGRSWREEVKRFCERRVEAGRVMPDIMDPTAARRPLPDSDEAEAIRVRLGGPARRRRYWRDDDPLRSVEIYLAEHLPADTRPTVKHYSAACRKDDRLVWPSNFKRKCGSSFSEVVVKMQARS